MFCQVSRLALFNEKDEKLRVYASFRIYIVGI